MQNSQIQDLFPVRLSPIKDKIQWFPRFTLNQKQTTDKEKILIFHCVKSVSILSFYGPYFPAFGLNTERYGVSQRKRSFLFQKISTILRILCVIMLKNTIRNKSLKDCLRTASYLLLKCCKRKWMQVPCWSHLFKYSIWWLESLNKKYTIFM